MTSLRLFLIITLSFLPLISSAQEGASAKNTPKATSTSDLEIPIDHLILRLDPLTVSELETEAIAWQKLVKEAALDVAEVAIESRAAPAGSAGRGIALEKLGNARDKIKSRVERLNAVLDSWELKGGDPAQIRMYVKAVNGAKVDTADASSTAIAVGRWATSQEGGIKWAINLTIFALIMLVSWFVSGLVKRIVSKAMDRHDASSALLDTFIKKLIGRLVLIAGFLIGLSTLGVNIGAMVALIGGASFVIAFAMQDTLSNFANGIMLLLYQPFDVGDAVEIGGVSGAVEAVTLVNTQLRTFDNKRVLVPNKSVWGQVITNATANDKRRVDMTFGIGYGDDIEKAQQILSDIVGAHSLILEDPAPVIQVHELADSSVNFICRPWSKTSDYWDVFWDVTKSVKQEFDANNISIPFPQQDIHLHKVEQP